MGMSEYPQDFPIIVKLLNNYIAIMEITETLGGYP